MSLGYWFDSEFGAGIERPKETQLFLTELHCGEARVWERRLTEWKVPK